MVAVPTNDLPPMTEAEYLAFADAQELKYEYARGDVFAMTGGSFRHAAITANAITHLSIQLRDADCTVTSPDIRVHVVSEHAYRYPDVTVVCGEPVYVEGRTDTITNPALLVEVLSPGTALKDYNEKLTEYTQIDSLETYVLIAQDKPKVEVFRRHESGQWLYQYTTGTDAEIAVTAGGTTINLALAELYRRVRWDEDEQTNDDAE